MRVHASQSSRSPVVSSAQRNMALLVLASLTRTVSYNGSYMYIHTWHRNAYMYIHRRSTWSGRPVTAGPIFTLISHAPNSDAVTSCLFSCSFHLQWHRSWFGGYGGDQTSKKLSVQPRLLLLFVRSTAQPQSLLGLTSALPLERTQKPRNKLRRNLTAWNLATPLGRTI